VSDEPLRVVVTVPGLRVTTPGNSRKHWRVEAKRARRERLATLLACKEQVADATRAALLKAPRLRVRFVRVGRRRLDCVNTFGALKHVIDGMADWLKVDDGSDWYSWEIPTQEKGDDAVRIELEAM
jgi:hypothetical protein